MTIQKATRDVVDLVTRPITQGIDIDGDGGGSFTIDGTNIGTVSPASAGFTDITMSGQINMANSRISNVGYPAFSGDGANRQYVDDQVAALGGAVGGGFLPIGGGSLGGTLNMNGNRVTNVPTSPASGTDAANADYVNAQIAAAVGAIPPPPVPGIFRADHGQFTVVDDGAWKDPGHHLAFTTGPTGLTILNMDIWSGWSLSSWDGVAWLEIFSPGYSSLWQLGHQAHGEGFESWTVNRHWHGTLAPLTTYTVRLRYNSHPNNHPNGWHVAPVMLAICW